MKKLHLPALLALGGQLATIAASPLVTGVLPAHWAAALGATIAAAQAVTKAIHTKGSE